MLNRLISICASQKMILLLVYYIFVVILSYVCSLLLVSVNLYLYFVKENPDNVVKAMNAVGVDAFRGATQLNVVEPDNGDCYLNYQSTEFLEQYPHEAKFLIDHVVYLPVNKFVPFYELDKIAHSIGVALLACSQGNETFSKKPRFVSKL